MKRIEFNVELEEQLFGVEPDAPLFFFGKEKGAAKKNPSQKIVRDFYED
jgi:hypothetical protein